MKRFKPGHKVPLSGQYGVVGRGGHLTKDEVTNVKGAKFPPTIRKKMGYKLTDKTK